MRSKKWEFVCFGVFWCFFACDDDVAGGGFFWKVAVKKILMTINKMFIIKKFKLLI